MNKLELHRTKGTTLVNRNLFLAAEEEFKQWLSESISNSDYIQAATAANSIGCCYSGNGRYSLAKDMFLEAEKLLNNSQHIDTSLAIKLRANLISVRWAAGQTDEAWKEMQELSANYSLQLNPRLLLLRGSLALERGCLEEARQDLMLTANMYLEQGSSQHEAIAISNLGIVYSHQGKLDLAQELLDKAIEAFESAGDFKNMAYSLTERAMVAHQQKYFDDALEYCSRSLKHLLSDMTALDRREIANVCKVLALTFKAMGDKERSDNYARRALNYYNAQINPYINEQGNTFASQLQSTPLGSHHAPKHHSSFYQLEYTLSYIDASLHLIDTAERMDQYTIGHSSRVTGYCAILADYFNLPSEEKEALLFAARFHDLGKVWIPQEILNKPSALSHHEWSLMQQHPFYGAEMLRMLIPDSPAAKLIESHHERYDGKGYPHSLTHESVSIATHILGLADAYDAMTSNRAYRDAISHSSAMSILLSQSGLQFHPDVVEAWFEIHQL